jgi:23S rRNA (uracil1939-C5)-methyltransferase
MFKVSPDAFHQLNTKQMEKMYDLVLDSKQFSSSDIVFDLYSGIGITSLLIAGKVKGVYGIDYSEASVADAKENARINNVKNIQFITDHVEGALPKLFKQNIKPDVIVLDPPRSGMSNAVIEAVKKVLPKKIIYMSCNPSTLAKNISELIDNYRIISINPIDMFPQSASVESVTFLELKQEGR